MKFHIPSAKSKLSLFVINKDFYIKKDTGEMRVSIQVLVPAGSSRPNKNGYSVAEYTAEPAVYEALPDITESGPILVDFEAEPRESRNGFGNTTNTEHLMAVLSFPGQQAAQPQQQPAKGSDAAKS